MSSQDTERLPMEFFRRVWTPPHDLDAIDELMTEDYQITLGGLVIEGREAFKAWVAAFHTQLLDARTESQAVFANTTGDRVFSQWLCSGRNNGMLGLPGLPADGSPVSFTGIAIWEVRDGKLARCWWNAAPGSSIRTWPRIDVSVRSRSMTDTSTSTRSRSHCSGSSVFPPCCS